MYRNEAGMIVNPISISDTEWEGMKWQLHQVIFLIKKSKEVWTADVESDLIAQYLYR